MVANHVYRKGCKDSQGQKTKSTAEARGAEKSKNNIAADNTGECEIRKRFGRESRRMSTKEFSAKAFTSAAKAGFLLLLYRRPKGLLHPVNASRIHEANS